jgi:hypothetical protein
MNQIPIKNQTNEGAQNKVNGTQIESKIKSQIRNTKENE